MTIVVRSLTFLSDIDAQYPGAVSGMYDLFERFAVAGKETFSDDLCHLQTRMKKYGSSLKAGFAFYGFTVKETGLWFAAMAL